MLIPAQAPLDSFQAYVRHEKQETQAGVDEKDRMALPKPIMFRAQPISVAQGRSF